MRKCLQFLVGSKQKTESWPKIFWKILKFDLTPNDTSTAYDIQSIMHYDGTLRGFFSKPIMTNKVTGKSIGVNRKMSPMDIQKLNKMYPCKSSCGKFCLFYVTVPLHLDFLYSNPFRSGFKSGTAR